MKIRAAYRSFVRSLPRSTGLVRMLEDLLGLLDFAYCIGYFLAVIYVLGLLAGADYIVGLLWGIGIIIGSSVLSTFLAMLLKDLNETPEQD